MAAYRKARDIGAPGIELDVHVCAPSGGSVPGTGDLVVAHDDTFKRTAPAGANGGGRDIGELTLAEIRAIDVGSFFGPGFSGERPPLLDEVLREFCPAMYVDIELKSGKVRDDPLPALVAALLRQLGPAIEQSVTVSSFNPFCLAAFKKAAPHIPTAIIYCVSSEVPLILHRGFGRFISACDYAKPIHRQVSRLSHFRIATLEKRPLVPWTIDDPALAKRMLALGCEGIITNRPQDMIALKEGSGVLKHGYKSV
jgi:glycerophosphoryl diester phosphodiesterase